MLRFFFHRKSVMVKLFYGGALCLTFFYFAFDSYRLLNLTQKIFFYLFLIQTAFAQGVELYPWYPQRSAGPGIKLQFQKALVPLSYIWFILMLVLWWKPSLVFLIFCNLLLLPISIVACILIYFYHLDPDPSRPNELSGKDI